MSELTEGRYTIADDLTSLIIRSAKSTTAGEVGRYFKNDSFAVYQVFPEQKGIVWGRVSENATGAMRFVGMRVNNHLKVSALVSSTGESLTLVELDKRITVLEMLAGIAKK